MPSPSPIRSSRSTSRCTTNSLQNLEEPETIRSTYSKQDMTITVAVATRTTTTATKTTTTKTAMPTHRTEAAAEERLNRDRRKRRQSPSANAFFHCFKQTLQLSFYITLCLFPLLTVLRKSANLLVNDYHQQQQNPTTAAASGHDALMSYAVAPEQILQLANRFIDETKQTTTTRRKVDLKEGAIQPTVISHGNSSTGAKRFKSKEKPHTKLKRVRGGTGATSATSMTLTDGGFPSNNATTTTYGLAVFYNIFVSDNQPGQKENALRIVREQLKQVKESYAAKQEGGAENGFAVFYVTIGQEGIVTPALMDQPDFCGDGLSCHFVKHVQDASEVETLAELYNFCSLNQNSKVTYLHNKGSFHYNLENENWRPILTDAALSEMCSLRSREGDPNGECNLCGLQFFTQWTNFIPGNMFTAKCSYVEQLVPPREFRSRLENVVTEVMKLTVRQQIVFNRHVRKDFFGLERYSDEHWIASHPGVKPCDCDATGDLWRYHYSRMSLHDMSWSMAPRHYGIPSYEESTPRQRQDEGDVSLRVRDYFLLAGNLVKWFSLYGKAPESDSWAWKWFPDGEFWQEEIRKYGKHAVEIVTRTFSPPELHQVPAFSDRVVNSSMWRENTVAVATSTSSEQQGGGKDLPPVAFFDVSLWEGKVIALSMLSTIKQQLSFVATSPASTLYYLTSGSDVLDTPDLCEDGTTTSNLTCVRLAPHNNKEKYTGDMIRHVHDFCTHNPNRRIIYLNIGTKKHSFLSHVSRAVTHEQCLESIRDPDESKCNLCGLGFNTLPTFKMTGDMWAAHCSYIKQLLRPDMFVSKMNHFIGNVMTQSMTSRISIRLDAPPSKEKLGMDDHAIIHWVGSHPSLMPCDLSHEDSTIWSQRDLAADDVPPFKLHKGPHMLGTDFDSSRSIATREIVIMDESLRFREYNFLAGHVMKWYELYGEVPASSSWAWSFFPDGSTWLEATKKLGSDAVQNITSKYETKIGLSSVLISIFPQPIFAELQSFRTNFTAVNEDKSPVVFFDMHIGEDVLASEAASKMQLIRNQLKILNSSLAPVVYYLTSGSHLKNWTSICSSDDGLKCHRLAHHDQQYRGETIRHLHNFCKRNPSQTVLHVKNEGPHGISDPLKQDKLVQHATMAVSSKLCMHALQDTKSNLCGLNFYTMPAHMMIGNIWAAECSYINKLLPPETFVDRMRDFASKTILLKTWENLKFGILAGDRLDQLGVDAYGMDHWVGSHPSLEPSDVFNNKGIEYWTLQNREISDFSLSIGARLPGAPYDDYDPKQEMRVREIFSLRMREFYYLPGYLLKWFMLYDEAPEKSSWVWSFYPDSERWYSAVQKYGTKATEIVTGRQRLKETTSITT